MGRKGVGKQKPSSSRNSPAVSPGKKGAAASVERVTDSSVASQIGKDGSNSIGRGKKTKPSDSQKSNK